MKIGVFVYYFFLLLANTLVAQKLDLLNPKYCEVQYLNKQNLKYYFDSAVYFKQTKEIVLITDAEGFGNYAVNYFDSSGFESIPGIINDYTVANRSNAPYYKSWHKGNWNYNLNHEQSTEKALGINGFTVYTNQDAASLNFTYENSLPSQKYTLVLYASTLKSSMDITVKINKTSVYNVKPSEFKDDIITVDIGETKISSIEIKTIRNSSSQIDFTLMGVYCRPQSGNLQVVHQCNLTTGIFDGISKQANFIKQLKDIKPKLIILEPGNSEIKHGFNKWDLDNSCNKLFTALRTKFNSTSIMLISPQVMKLGKYSTAETANYAKLLKDHVLNHNFGFIDWHAISGGAQASGQWNSYFNFSTFQYNEKANKIKSNLIASAFYKGLNQIQSKEIESNVLQDLHIISKLPAKTEEIDSIFVNPNEPRKILHQVARGQNLYRLSLAYNVSQSDIVKWNNLQTEELKEGQIVIIFQGPKEDFVPKMPKVEQKTKKTIQKYHTVKRGQTLFSIAKQYKLTIEELKSLNKLKSNSIDIGQILRVK